MPSFSRRAMFHLGRGVRRIGRELSGKAQPISADYSLAPFRATRSIFVHIPKTGGVSISRALYGNLGGGHTTIAEYALRFSRREFDDFFKFTFVRNPWSRLFSAYRFLKAGGFDAGDAAWAETHLGRFGTFEAFVLEGLSDPHVRAFSHFRPQLSHLLDHRSHVPLDFIGFFETLEGDFEHVRARIGGTAPLATHNASPKGPADYRSQYSPEMIAAVEAHYAQDIAALGYDFDNKALPDQLRARDDQRLLSGQIG